MTLPLDAWLSARRQAVDAALDRFLPSPGPTPTIVCEAMRYSVFAGGKRVRPMLVLAAAEAAAARTGVAEEDALTLALPAACAVELIHTYSLVHDDLPAMDDDSMRRGAATAHVVYGEGMAILAGDALLTEAFALMARELLQRTRRSPTVNSTRSALSGRRPAPPVWSEVRPSICSRARGAEALDGDALSGMHARKTGALIRGSACAGGIMAGASGANPRSHRSVRAALGLAFQIVDDILDVEGASVELGKTAGKDAAAGKPTSRTLRSRRIPPLAAECGERALGSLEPVQVSGQLPAIVRWVLGRTH